MDHYSILDQSTPPQGSEVWTAELDTEFDMTQMGANRSSQGGVIGVMAAVNGSSAGPFPAVSVPRCPGEDAGHSLTAMAQRDLDAALQLLAERAQYITGASGAAIALRRSGYNDMLCRASSGPNAPELGALLSAEFGLSGESVRTRLPLRCDDAERDARVNREGCRQLGIASVAVMPIVSDDEVLGVFELFSGKVNAFEERDLSALQRLGGMVETAVRLARTAQVLPAEIMGEFVAEVSDVPAIEVEAEVAMSAAEVVVANVADAEAVPTLPKPVAAESTVPKVAIKKPLLWSAAASTSVTQPPESDQSHVPPVLRNRRKCETCGFPVSEGRTVCVECEEKQWRGRLYVSGLTVRPRTAAAAPTTVPAVNRAVAAEVVVSTPADKPTPQSGTSQAMVQPVPQAVESSVLSPVSSSFREEASTLSATEVSGTSEGTLPFLSAGISSSESWLSANKYVLGAIVMVGVVMAVIALLR